ncbi:GNAT family N-acetyltransferase [Priestia taiwanensis]|uniref:N-acetyltransferase n=1 Tax=Priestia taiwanensis TaxID=1347902 RepID=A0A917AIF6_9BACI|nr:GNAT family protein [Priestia taiwanensis]MBM7361439.1 RimJ/RimL family protein N-acetyltransferase [Priestia taiwanensis]GGE54161.1 N-acetyltransferase [Priestia taiwanensis]
MNTQDLFMGEKVILTTLEKEDAKEISTWHNNAQFGRLLSSLPATPQSVTQIEKWLEEEMDDSTNYLFGIRTRSEHQLVGYVELERVELSNGNAWLAIALSPEHWKKGYGMEAMKKVLTYAFGELCLHRVQLTVFSYNTGAISLYEKLGFVREGAYREYIHRNDERYDMYLYGLLKTEWKG